MLVPFHPIYHPMYRSIAENSYTRRPILESHVLPLVAIDHAVNRLKHLSSAVRSLCEFCCGINVIDFKSGFFFSKIAFTDINTKNTYDISSIKPTTQRRTSWTGSWLNARIFSRNSSNNSSSECTISSWIFLIASHRSAGVFPPSLHSFNQSII